MISIDGLTVEFSGTTLFKDISFTIGDKDRIALMGKNGAGKSTLLKIIAGVRSATRGRVTVGEGGKVGYLPQHLQVEDGRTLVEEASRAFEHLFEIERRIAGLNEQLTNRTDYESESYMRLIEEVTAISEKFYAVDLTNYQEDVERILLGLGFERSDFTRQTSESAEVFRDDKVDLPALQTSEFSGGWRMRIELAKLLLQKPDLLLLDEPTNHLDIESIEWLEDFLMNNAKAVMVISHDKAFVGRNGEGKSTMVKAIMGQIDFEGEIRIGHNVRIGYFAQNEASGLDESITVFKTVDDIAVGDIRTRIRDILGAFMFGKEASEKLVKVLSGGERTRLAMIKLLLEPVNLLILDEPTNHLDLKTKEILKEALMAFDGTLIVVSHDRDFLDGLTSKIYEFSHGRVTEHLDGVYGFLRKKKIENISEIERRKA